MPGQGLGGIVEAAMKSRRRGFLGWILPSMALCGASAFGQQSSLSLAKAIDMARERNGDVRAAFLDLESARSRVRQSFSFFLPTVTPSYSWTNSRSQTFTGASSGTFDATTRTSSVVARWQLLDTGERDWSYKASRRSADATEATTLQTVRSIIFAIQQLYFDTIRARELLKVAQAEVQRAQTLLEATNLQIEVGAAPKKDALQAKADLLNAKVSLLQAQNFAATADADLKAIIGWDSAEPLPDLERAEAPKELPAVPELADITKEGLQNRLDLVAQRKRIEAQNYSRMIQERNALISLSVDALYSRNFSPLVEDERRLSFLASIPLFDGGYAKEQARQARITLDSQKAQLTQSERDARAEIEADLTVLKQDALRVQAAQAALEAAQENYRAALESQKLGAEGTSVITVLTAQVSLVTAESNFVQAVFDYTISEARLRLATGRPLQGEPKIGG